MPGSKHVAEVIADGYRYPSPDSLRVFTEAVESWTDGAVKRHLTRFIDEVDKLSLGAWEELHTATLDLSPKFIPYVGHVEWGENYRRGEFMADLNRAMYEAGVELDGELPDHIAPILRYLAVVAEPLTDLIDVLPSALATMTKTLAKADSDSPYRHLLAATVEYSHHVAGRPSSSPAGLLRRRNLQPGTPVHVGRRQNGEHQ